MIQFQCDYTEGAHPKIIERLTRTNLEQTIGYGEDGYCEHARELIRQACQAPEADVQFMVGGTQTNFTVISSILRPYQGVLSAESGHINVHETGAVEATGHKVLTLPSADGKIRASQVREAYEAHWKDGSREHIVQPGMVYISHPTENGTLYTKGELKALYQICQKLGLPLFLDGARLGYGLMSEASDLTLPEIAEYTDVFYIGGTKVGALFGEAVVITDPAIAKDFRYMIKQKGAMLAKGRLLGLQFETLFTDGLYFQIADHADRMAMKLKEAFRKKGYPLLFDSYTNQQFPVIPNSHLGQLKEKYVYNFWERVDRTHSAVRFCTSWATKEEAVDALIRDLEELDTLETGFAGEEDLRKIAEMEREIFPDAWSEASLADTLKQKSTVIITAKKDRELIGYLIASLVPEEGEILRIAVKKEFRRQGAAGHMILELENVCEETDVHKLMLEVRESNQDAISFYKEKGFTEDGLRKDYYTDPAEDAVLMSRELGR